MISGEQSTAYTVEGQVADARASVADITAEAQFCVSEIGVLRREDLEIALASEVLRLRAALDEVARLCPKPGGAGQVARDALRIGT